MKLPPYLLDKNEWVLIGPMGTKNSIKSHTDAYTMAIDGGAHYITKSDVWIGDGDSVSSEISSQHIIKLDVKKNSSDLAMGLSLFKKSSYELHLYGFLGGRSDHEIFNLGEVLNFLENKTHSKAIFYSVEQEVIFECYSQGIWEIEHLGIFSVGTHKETSIKLKGNCDYNLEEFTKLAPLSSFGLSNKAAGKFSLQNLGPIFIFRGKN